MAIWQKLVPTVDGKRVALREYLVFDDHVRDQLLECELDMITAATRRLVKECGQPMEIDAKKRFDEGKISSREYKLLLASSENADKDAGL